MGFSSGGGRSGMSEINVTPLVDVMLVLLIIFMVTAPLIQQGVKVDLPEARAQPMETKEESKLVLSAKADQSLYIGDAPVSLDELEEKLKHNPKAQADKEIYLHADKSLPYGFVVEVMAAVQRAGIPAMGMVTDPGERAKTLTAEIQKRGNPKGKLSEVGNFDQIKNQIASSSSGGGSKPPASSGGSKPPSGSTGSSGGSSKPPPPAR